MGKLLHWEVGTTESYTYAPIAGFLGAVGGDFGGIICAQAVV